MRPRSRAHRLRTRPYTPGREPRRRARHLAIHRVGGRRLPPAARRARAARRGVVDSRTAPAGREPRPPTRTAAASDRYPGTSRHAATSETGLAGMRGRRPALDRAGHGPGRREPRVRRADLRGLPAAAKLALEPRRRLQRPWPAYRGRRTVRPPAGCGKRGQQVRRWLERRGRRAVRPSKAVPRQRVRAAASRRFHRITGVVASVGAQIATGHRPTGVVSTVRVPGRGQSAASAPLGLQEPQCGLLARGRTGRRTAIPARTVETPRRSSVNLFKGHTSSPLAGPPWGGAPLRHCRSLQLPIFRSPSGAVSHSDGPAPHASRLVPHPGST